MKNNLSLIKSLAIASWLAASLACGTERNRTSENSAAADSRNGAAQSENAVASPVPSATPFSFDAEKLIAYTKINQEESEKIIKGKEVTVTGYVISTAGVGDRNDVKFYSKLGEVWCSGEKNKQLEDAVERYLFSKDPRSRMPLVTAKGIYKSAMPGGGNEKGKIYVYLEECKVLKVTL